MTTDIPEVVGFATHHDEPMLFPNRKEAAAYCDDGEEPVALIRLSDYKARLDDIKVLEDQLDAMAEYKVAAHQLIGIPASVGISEPIEGFAKRPQDIMPAVRDMALRIELLEHQAAERDRLLAESRANDKQAMAYLNEVRAIAGGDDFPDMVERVAKLQAKCEHYKAECENLRSIISDLKDWDCDVSGGFLSIPVDLRRRMQEAIDGAMQEVT